jgi:REP-associated tyrosine transposase
MTDGLKRFYGHRHLHFITASCYQRTQLLNSPDRRDLLLKMLEQVRRKYRFVVVGYVVMPEHFHLLISEPDEADPSVVIQALKVGFVRGLGAKIHRFWHHRFYDFNLWSRSKRIEKLRYIHRNPVKRGLVASPEEWRWSSFRAYAYGESGPVVVNDWSVVNPGVRGGLTSAHFSQKQPEVGHPRDFPSNRRNQAQSS